MNNYYTKTRQWIEWHAAKITAAIALLYKPDVIAAFCMFFLNQHARAGGEGKFAIYQLKDQLLKLFYNRGYCRSVKLEKQTMTCNNCDENGITVAGFFRGRKCVRCNGTHIHREHLLFAFHFVIENKNFLWHQPVSLVDWLKPDPSETTGVYVERETIIYPKLSRKELVKKLAVVYLFLQRHGIKPTYNPAQNHLLWCIRYDTMNFMRRTITFSRFGSCLYYLRLAWRALLDPENIPF